MLDSDVLSELYCMRTKAWIKATGEESYRARQRCLQLPSCQRRRQLDRQSDTAERHTR